MIFEKDYDIAIVGYGLTGVTLANLLIKLGLSVLVIEREAEISPRPGAMRFNAECMRIFQNIGITEKLLQEITAGIGTKFKNAAGEALMTWESVTPKTGKQACATEYRVHQPDLEAILRDKIKDHCLLDLKLQHELFKIDEQQSTCTLSFENLSNGQLLHATAKFVVGCDGENSLVRRLMDTTFEDLNLNSQSLIVNFIGNNKKNDLDDYSIQYCNAKRPMCYVKGTGLRYRWEIMLKADDDIQSVSRPEFIWALLKKYIHPDHATIEYSSVYTHRSVLAKRWQKDRLMIAGRAAHQTPTFMGQEMAEGIRDVANLAWKLYEVVQYQHYYLLDTYDSERNSQVLEFTYAAVNYSEIIQNNFDDAGLQQQINQLKNFVIPTPQLGHGFYLSGFGLNGKISPQFFTQNNLCTDDLIGYQYALFVHSDLKSLIVDLQLERINNLSVLAAECSESMAWLQDNNAVAILIRPDRYVFGKATNIEDIESLLISANIYDLVSME